MKTQDFDIIRKKPMQARAIATKEAILLAAAQFLKKYDFEILTTNKVAELAGVSIGSLYQYFATKEAIMAQLIKNQFKQDILAIQEHMNTVNTTCFIEGVEKIVETVVALFADRPNLRIIIHREARRFNIVQDKDHFKNEIKNVFIQNFQKIGLGIYKAPSEMQMSVLISAVTGALLTAAQEFPESLKDKVFKDELVKLILGYYQFSKI